MNRDVPPVYGCLAIPALLLCVGLFVLPLAQMLSLAVRDPAPGLGNLVWLASSDAVGRILWTTLRFAVLASLLATGLGFVLAYVAWLGGRAVATIVLTVLLVSFWLSVLIRCFALIMLLGPNGPLNGLLGQLGLGPLRLIRNEPGVLIGMVHYLVPFAALTILPALRTIDPALLAAARSLGAGRTRVFRTVVLPLAAPGTVAALALCCVIALGFYITPALLGGGRVVMIAEFITFYVQNVMAWGKAAALALCLLLAIGLSWLLVRLPGLALRRRLGT